MSKKAGVVSAETKEKILRSAIKEFKMVGFSGASVRRICADAGVTTGALYFFFRGKDDLFTTVLSKVTEPFLAFMKQHFEEEKDFMSRSKEENEQADLLVSSFLIDSYFREKDCWDILLDSYSYPAVQNFWKAFAVQSTSHYMEMLQKAAAAKGRVNTVDRYDLHLFVHMQMETIVTVISKDFTREEMERRSKVAMKMLLGAFHALMDE